MEAVPWPMALFAPPRARVTASMVAPPGNAGPLPSTRTSAWKCMPVPVSTASIAGHCESAVRQG